MNSFERVWAALNLEEPDRIPIFTPGIDGNLADEVLGKPQKTTFERMDETEAQYPDNWIEIINSVVPDTQITVFSKAAIAASQLGFDACGAGYIPFIL